MHHRTEQEIMQNWKTNSEPLVSICCTTYNHEKYIEEALDSFLMQETDFPFEIVIDDDCSSDNSAEFIKKYIKKFPNIMHVRLRKKNVGMMENSLGNMQRAKGKYIALCEGDDYWTDANKLQIQLDLMTKNPECYLSFHPADEVMDGQLTGRVYATHETENRVFTNNEMIRKIGASFCPTASMILRREVMDPIPDFYTTAPVGDASSKLYRYQYSMLMIIQRYTIYLTVLSSYSFLYLSMTDCSIRPSLTM